MDESGTFIGRDAKLTYFLVSRKTFIASGLLSTFFFFFCSGAALGSFFAGRRIGDLDTATTGMFR